MKYLFYILSKIVFKWSLIYFLVFIFLEDIKRSFISSHFSPHLIIPIILLSGLLVFFSEKIEKKNENDNEDDIKSREYKRYDSLIIVIMAVLAGLLTLKYFGFDFVGLLLAVVIFFIVIGSTKYLWRQLR